MEKKMKYFLHDLLHYVPPLFVLSPLFSQLCDSLALMAGPSGMRCPLVYRPMVGTHCIVPIPMLLSIY